MELQDYLSRMLQDLQLRGMSTSTQNNYVRSVRKISEHCKKLPSQITEEEIREYFLYLKNVRKYGGWPQQLLKWIRVARAFRPCHIIF